MTLSPQLVRFEIEAPGLDPAPWLEFFALRAVPGLETVEGACYRRVVRLQARSERLVLGALELDLTLEGVVRVELEAATPGGVDQTWARAELTRRIQRLLGLDGVVSVARFEADLHLGEMVRQRPGLRIPGAWDGFEQAVRAVLGQQISVKGARTIASRIVRRADLALPGAGERFAFPGPAQLLALELNGLGLVGARIRTLRALSEACLEGRLELERVDDFARLREQLLALPGIGPWTAEYVALRLGDRDAFPSSDLGLLRAFDPSRRVAPAELLRHAERWRPFRALAAQLLWSGDPGSGILPAHAHTTLPPTNSEP